MGGLSNAAANSRAVHCPGSRPKLIIARPPGIFSRTIGRTSRAAICTAATFGFPGCLLPAEGRVLPYDVANVASHMLHVYDGPVSVVNSSFFEIQPVRARARACMVLPPPM